MVPFNSTDAQKPGMSYQIVSTFNGELDNADTINDKDNFEIKFSQDSAFHTTESTSDAVIDSDLRTRWDEDGGKEWTA
jgi:hypothetical protein